MIPKRVLDKRLIGLYADVKKAYICRLCRAENKTSISYKIKVFLNHLKDCHHINEVGADIHPLTSVGAFAAREVET